jgi:hypothetical protein
MTLALGIRAPTSVSHASQVTQFLEQALPEGW